MHNRHRIQRASRRLIRVLTVLLVGIPLMMAGIWIFINHLPSAWQDRMFESYVQFPLPVSASLMGFAVSMIPGGIMCYSIWILIRLFRLYEAGHIFTPANVLCFRKLSRSLIGWFFAGILTDPLMSVALTLHNPPGHRMLSIGIGSPDVTALMVGLILGVITWVMEEASVLQDEQDHTI